MTALIVAMFAWANFAPQTAWADLDRDRAERRLKDAKDDVKREGKDAKDDVKRDAKH